MIIECSISIGEFLDKISILRIKAKRIKSEQKLMEVKRELAILEEKLASFENPIMESYIHRLEEINECLWNIEDAIRKKELNNQFDETFIALARDVYATNDERFFVKNEVNNVFGSNIKEQKEY